MTYGMGSEFRSRLADGQENEGSWPVGPGKGITLAPEGATGECGHGYLYDGDTCPEYVCAGAPC